MTTASQTLRNLLSAGSPVIMPFAHDALSARLIELAGFEAVGASGSGMTASLLAVPDIALTTMTEMVEQTARIVQATELPVLADADNGHGNHVNVWRTISGFERAGAAGVFMEDQKHPKRCGHYQGTEVVPAKEMVTKLKAALSARSDPDFVIIARTDARQSLGLEEAIDRANRYADTGADMIFVEAPQSVEELEFLPKKIQAPLMVNMVEGGRTPILPPEDLAAMGYRLIIWPDTAIAAATRGMQLALETLKKEGISDPASLVLFDEMRKVLRHEEFIEIDRAIEA